MKIITIEWYGSFTTTSSTVNSQIIECIYYWHFEIINQNVRLIIAISGKAAYKYMYQISECEFLLLRYAHSPIIRNNKIVESGVKHFKLPNSEQSYKGKVKTHKYINRQNQSTTGKL
jgi:hypothetical protein